MQHLINQSYAYNKYSIKGGDLWPHLILRATLALIRTHLARHLLVKLALQPLNRFAELPISKLLRLLQLLTLSLAALTP